MSGKGSKQRPTEKKSFEDGWDRIWGNRDVEGEDKDVLDGVNGCTEATADQ